METQNKQGMVNLMVDTVKEHQRMGLLTEEMANEIVGRLPYGN